MPWSNVLVSVLDYITKAVLALLALSLLHHLSRHLQRRCGDGTSAARMANVPPVPELGQGSP